MFGLMFKLFTLKGNENASMKQEKISQFFFHYIKNILIQNYIFVSLDQRVCGCITS